MTQKLIGTVVQLVALIFIGIIIYIVFKKVSESDIFQSPEEKAAKAEEKRRSDRGIFDNILRGLFGEERIDRLAGGYQTQSDTDPSKNTFDKNTDDQKLRAAQEINKEELIDIVTKGSTNPLERALASVSLPKSEYNPTIFASKGKQTGADLTVAEYKSLTEQEKARLAVYQDLGAKNVAAKLAAQTKTAAQPTQTQKTSSPPPVSQTIFTTAKKAPVPPPKPPPKPVAAPSVPVKTTQQYTTPAKKASVFLKTAAVKK